VEAGFEVAVALRVGVFAGAFLDVEGDVAAVLVEGA
jgi:hypothetical protein